MTAWSSRPHEAAITEIERHGVLAIVATPPPSYENGSLMTLYGATADAIREVAGRGRPLLDIATRWRDDGSGRAAAYYLDLIHPSPDLQRVMRRSLAT